MSRRKRFLRDEGGGALVEFALVLPLMVLILAGSVELVAGFQAQQKVYHVAFALADIVSQAGSTGNDVLTQAQLADDVLAGQTLIDPLPTGALSQTVASVTSDGKGGVTVDWIYGDRASISVPKNLVQTGQTLIVAQADYVYHPFTTAIWPANATVTFSKQAYLQLRNLKAIPTPQ